MLNPKAEASLPSAVKFKAQTADAKELENFFCHYESEIGFGSSFGSMVNVLNGLSTHDVVDTHTNALARIGGGTEMRRVWRTLNILDTRGDRHTILVLHRMHGPFVLEDTDTEKRATGPNLIPLAYRTAFGDDGAPIVVMTPAANQVRDELAYQRSSIRVDAVTANIEAIPERANVDFWRFAKHCEALMLLLKGMSKPFNDAQRDDRRGLKAELASVRKAMLDAMQATPPSSLGAVISAIGAADKETSVNDAIRHMLTRPKEQRDPFVKLAKAQALAMREEARAVYLRARREFAYL